MQGLLIVPRFRFVSASDLDSGNFICLRGAIQAAYTIGGYTSYATYSE